MAEIIREIRREAPHGPWQLSIGPTSLYYPAGLFSVAPGSEFSEATSDLERMHGTVEPLGLDSILDVPVRTDSSLVTFDVTETLLIRFSPIGFNHDTTRAVAVVSLDCGEGCGSLAVTGLRRGGQRAWSVAFYRELSRR